MHYEASEDLGIRLARLSTLIDSGEGDIAAALEERESVKRQMEAERLRVSKAADAAYTANLQARSDEFRARLIPPAEGVADTVPRLLWWLSQLEELELEALRGGAGNVNFSEETGIPFNFARTLREAINQASSGIEWHYDFLDDPAKKNPLPRVKQMMVDLRGFRQTDVNGRPLEGHTYIG